MRRVSARPPRSARRGLAAVVATSAVLTVLVGCGVAKDARDAVVADLTEGTWRCEDRSGQPNLEVTSDRDGAFTLTNPDPAPGDAGEDLSSPGSWKVVGRTVEASLEVDGDRRLWEVRGFDDFQAKAGTIEVANPEDEDERYTFDIEVKGTDTVAIVPRDEDEWPSAPWTCERQ